MENAVLREKRLTNGLIIQTLRQAGMFREVRVVVDGPLEDYKNICSKEEAECLTNRLAEKYSVCSIQELVEL